MVRGRGSVLREHGHVLPVAGAQKEREDRAGGDGHVASLREVHDEERPQGGHPLRQVSCDKAPGQGVGYGPQAGIQAACRQGPFIYQGSDLPPLKRTG